MSWDSSQNCLGERVCNYMVRMTLAFLSFLVITVECANMGPSVLRTSYTGRCFWFLWGPIRGNWFPSQSGQVLAARVQIYILRTHSIPSVCLICASWSILIKICTSVHTNFSFFKIFLLLYSLYLGIFSEVNLGHPRRVFSCLTG